MRAAVQTRVPRRSFWSDLEAIGLSEIAMAEEVRARRAIVNAAGGPLSVKKKPDEPAARQLGELLRKLILLDPPRR